MIENISNKERSNAEIDQALNILLAEDDADDVLVFKLALNELKIPFNLNHADNGETLFQLLKELLPDIIFLDINIPNKDGLSCLMEIRKNQLFDAIPVILISGFRYGKYINDAFTNGANYYIVKANNMGELVEYLKSIFSVDWKKVMYYPPLSQFVVGNS